MKRLKGELKKLLNKDITKYLNKYKIPLVIILVVCLLACIGLVATYAFYQSIGVTPIIGASTGKIADLDVRIMVEQKETNGQGLNKYEVYPYIPRAGYDYNTAKSYCTNGSSINYDATKFEANITAAGHDVCYLYFDVDKYNAPLDLTLDVYAEKVDSDGNGTGEYVKLDTTTLPALGYEMHEPTSDTDEHTSKCQNGSILSYSPGENMFTIEATEKDVCVAYMDAIDVDIALKVFVQSKKGSKTYYESKIIPNDAFYDLHTANDDYKSSCTGTSTMEMVNQKVIISATGRTSCVAYLDISSGPILESSEVTDITKNSATITLTNSTAGTTPTKYYFSSDGGKNYTESTTNSKTFTGLTSSTAYTFKAYSKDANGKTSRIFTTSAETSYAYIGLFPYATAAQTHTIEVSGYYKLQVWGAQGGNYEGGLGGKGGYSVGNIYLNKDDTIYVYTGGQGGATGAAGTNGGGSTNEYGGGGGGGTDIRINNDSLYARVIVAGGGGGNGYNTASPGGYGGGLTGGTGTNGTSNGGDGGTQTAGGAAYVDGIFGSAYANTGNGGGGGGGWYGGSPGTGGNVDSAGGGGSGYVYTDTTASNYPSGCLLNSNYYLKNASTVGGNTAFESTSGGTETGHEGNGYAKVTYIGPTLS